MDKRERIIVTAFDLFYRHGVHAVGINRVIADSGVAKKTLYNHFASKEDLLAATIDYRDQQFLTWMKSRMQRGVDGLGQLHEMFCALDDWFHERDFASDPISSTTFCGCYFINVSAEFSSAAHPIHQQCANHKNSILELIKGSVSKVISSELQALKTAEAIALLKEGAIVQAQVTGDLGSALKAWAVAEQLLSRF